MIFKTFHYAWRVLLRQKQYALLNLLGLTIGISTFILIASYVKRDILWDHIHKNGDRIYRLICITTLDSSPKHSPFNYPAAAPAMKAELPDIEAITRATWPFTSPVIRGEIKDRISGVRYVDGDFFDIFSFPLEAGDTKYALESPNNAVISRKVANQFFGKGENPLGQMIRVGENDYLITGVLKPIKEGSHFQHEILLPIESYNAGGNSMDSWRWFNFYTYLLLNENTSKEELEAQFPAFFAKYVDMDTHSYYLQSFFDIHLHSNHLSADYMNFRQGSFGTVVTFSALAIVVLLLAISNFINLSTALSTTRSRDIGLRKTLGATRQALIVQFLLESLILSFFAMLLSIVLIIMVTPWIENLIQRPLNIELTTISFTTISLLLITLITGLLAGIYPAFVLSSFSPVNVLRSRFNGPGKGKWLRKGLIIFQFVATITLIISSLFILLQHEYILKKPLGFTKENILQITPPGNLSEHYEALAADLEKIPGIQSISRTSGYIGNLIGWWGCLPEGHEEKSFNFFICDDSALETFQLKLTQGRFFNKDLTSDIMDKDGNGAIVLNEKAVEDLKWDNPLEKSIRISGHNVPVIGVVKDFHARSLYNPITPLLIFQMPSHTSVLNIRYDTEDTPFLVESVMEALSGFYPDINIHHTFLDSRLESTYGEVQKQATLIRIFTALALFIALLGLVGMSAYTVQRRKKEISIRKVLGASNKSIFGLLSNEYAILMLFSNLLAWPLAFCVMQKWLVSFAYKIDLSLWVFVISALSVMVTAFLVVSFQSWGTINTNPIENLRQE